MNTLVKVEPTEKAANDNATANMAENAPISMGSAIAYLGGQETTAKNPASMGLGVLNVPIAARAPMAENAALLMANAFVHLVRLIFFS